MKETKVLNTGGTKAPIVTHTFAADKGHYGSIWKIYIKLRKLAANFNPKMKKSNR